MYELAARTPPGQIWLKRFVGELGGKDGIVVDRDADLEQASQAIVASAFGYSGQKCSACSRAIIHQDVYDEVLGRCEELTGRLQLGDSAQAQTYIGPVIDSQAFGKIQGHLKAAPAEGRIVTGGGSDSSTGYFIEPTIVADVEPEARLMQEEIFGPVVAFCRARDFGHALHIANSTEYGLTGSLFTRSRSHIEQAKSAFHVGNLYFNRKCTGALVGVHPFGGFNLSGTDSKAGGPDYLLQFTQPKLTSELL
jgi:1-pyrroline-5-carboxylate dehydrogenase